MLNCAEELILLAIDDVSNSFHKITININVALIGALLMDLALQKRICVTPENIRILSTEKTDDKFLNEILEILNDFGTNCEPVALFSQLYNQRCNLKTKLLQDLEDKGIIKVNESKVLWLFKQRHYPVVDQKEEEEVLFRIRKIVLTDVEPEPRELALIALLKICGLLNNIFTDEELQQRKERFIQLKQMDEISPAVNKIIGEMQVLITTSYTT